MAYRVRVIGIFTKDARSGYNEEQRRARLASDIANANRVWSEGGVSRGSSGGSPGTACRLTFVSGGAFDETDTRIAASSVEDAFDSRISRIVDKRRAASGNAAAIYIVYVGGDYLANGIGIGSGGPRYRYYRSQFDYGFFGQVVMTDIAGSSRSPYTFAHEAGHCLFGYVDASNRYRGTDPSSNGSYHNADPRNLMYASTQAGRPRLNEAQCARAMRSTIVLDNSGRSFGGMPYLAAKRKRLGVPIRPRIRIARR